MSFEDMNMNFYDKYDFVKSSGLLGVNVLGTGATSTIYEIESKLFKKKYALKLITPSAKYAQRKYITKLKSIQNKQEREEFEKNKIQYIQNVINEYEREIRREIRILSKIKNIKNVLKIVDHYENFEYKGDVYKLAMVFEIYDTFLSSPGLSEYGGVIECIQKTGEELPASVIFKFFLDISTALNELKKLEIVHRDIKLENLMLRQNK